jgi:hypothetical protein
LNAVSECVETDLAACAHPVGPCTGFGDPEIAALLAWLVGLCGRTVGCCAVIAWASITGGGQW